MMLRHLLVASHETTTDLIVNGLLALSRHAQQQPTLRKDPGPREAAVEEFLHSESPVQVDANASEPGECSAAPTWRAARV